MRPQYSRTSSWADLPSTIYDHPLAFSKSNFADVTISKNANPGRSSQHAIRSSTSVFSHFFLPSASKGPLTPMKFRLPRSSTSAKINPYQSVSPTLYDDPAFSPDPLSHPFFATSEDFPRASSQAPNSPDQDLKHTSGPPLSLNPVPSFINATKDSERIQPSNATMSPNNAKTNSYLGTSSLTLTKKELTPPLPGPPTPVTPADGVTLESVKPSLPQKKKHTISLFWRKATDDPAEVTELQGQPPSYEAVHPTRPSAIRNHTSPAAHKPTKRPVLPSRPATTATDSKLPPAANCGAVGNRRVRAHELDRIDELDESNPLGLAVHHGGPYEAVHRLIKQGKSRISHNNGNQYQQDAGSHVNQEGSHKSSGRIQLSEPGFAPYVPPGVSLNLTPGQILPRDFQGHYQPTQQHSDHVPPATLGQAITNERDPDGMQKHWYRELRKQQRRQQDPVTQPQPPRFDTQDNNQNPQRWSNRHNSMPVIPTAMEGQEPVRGSQLNQRPTSLSQHSAEAPRRRSPSNPEDLNPANVNVSKRASLPHQAHLPTITFQDKLRLPHDYDTSLGQMNTHPQHPTLTQGSGLIDTRLPVPEVLPQHQLSTQHDYIKQDHERQGFRDAEDERRAQLSLQANSQIEAKRRNDHDTSSTQRSIFSDSGTSNSQSGGKGPQSRYLPKRLIMPAPLQSSQTNAPKYQIAPHIQRPVLTQDQDHGPLLSPPRVLGPYINGHPPRAQDIPMSQGRKLRKRASVQGPLPPVSYQPPVQYPVSFPAGMGHSEWHAAPPEKISKKVLSKRRTDL